MTAIEVLQTPFSKPWFNPAVYKDAEPISLYYRAADLKARFFLNRTASELYELGHKGRLVALLIHADMYLADRLVYELYPPPAKTSILLPVEGAQ